MILIIIIQDERAQPADNEHTNNNGRSVNDKLIHIQVIMFYYMIM